MPSDNYFRFEILVDGSPIPEYKHDDDHETETVYVESNLNTPVSYKTSIQETVQGEIENQEWPVTPYSIRITASDLHNNHYFKIFVDGVKVKGVSVPPGVPRCTKGFRDGTSIREFLFSLPRFAKDEYDRLTNDRQNRVGTIEVECWAGYLKKVMKERRYKELDFEQANKKDSFKITKGQYALATTKAGRVLKQRRLFRKTDHWVLHNMVSSQCVKYRMGHSLQEMGFTLVPYPVKQDVVRVSERPDRFQTSQNGIEIKSEDSLSNLNSGVTWMKPVKVEKDPDVIEVIEID